MGVTIEDGLMQRILDDVSEPGQLCLLEFALTLLWEQQTFAQLIHAAYDEIGGVKGVLAQEKTKKLVTDALPPLIYGVTELNRFDGHGNKVEGVGFSPDNQLLATAST